NDHKSGEARFLIPSPKTRYKKRLPLLPVKNRVCHFPLIKSILTIVITNHIHCQAESVLEISAAPHKQLMTTTGIGYINPQAPL
ncbi:MAG: hypothetical protein WC637_02155, partial [Victivallales bacterium]